MDTAATNPRFTARALEKVETRPGHLPWVKVGVFDGDRQVGEYVRSHPSFASSTFCPFERDGRWFALYSRNYMYTRLMSLPDCTDLGGEDYTNVEYRDHFCPTGYHVPVVSVRRFEAGEVDPVPYNPRHDPERWAKKVERGDGYCYELPEDDPAFKEAWRVFWEQFKAWEARHPFAERYAPWGFVCGCLWGDDGSWKIQFLDLSRAPEGVVKRDDRFGYIELPSGVSLKDAIRVVLTDGESRDLDRVQFRIALPVTFALAGKRVEE